MIDQGGTVHSQTRQRWTSHSHSSLVSSSPPPIRQPASLSSVILASELCLCPPAVCTTNDAAGSGARGGGSGSEIPLFKRPEPRLRPSPREATPRPIFYDLHFTPALGHRLLGDARRLAAIGDPTEEDCLHCNGQKATATQSFQSKRKPRVLGAETRQDVAHGGAGIGQQWSHGTRPQHRGR